MEHRGVRGVRCRGVVAGPPASRRHHHPLTALLALPGGVGWVYAIYVNVSGGELLVVEAPSTPTPLVTTTIDATLAAAFNIQPTSSRMPTFTPPPPLTVPQFTEVSAPREALVAPGVFVVSLVLLGVTGLLVSIVLRK